MSEREWLEGLRPEDEREYYERGCSCGTCGIVGDGHGYAWCARYTDRLVTPRREHLMSSQQPLKDALGYIRVDEHWQGWSNDAMNDLRLIFAAAKKYVSVVEEGHQCLEYAEQLDNSDEISYCAWHECRMPIGAKHCELADDHACAPGNYLLVVSPEDTR